MQDARLMQIELALRSSTKPRHANSKMICRNLRSFIVEKTEYGIFQAQYCSVPCRIKEPAMQDAQDKDPEFGGIP